MQGKILVVDDLPDLRATIRGILQDVGHIAQTVATQEEALEAIRRERFHVAILDVRLDETDEENKDGLVLMHKIGKLDPTIAVIILTGYADVSMVQDALQPGPNGVRAAFGFLQKNELEKLTDTVALALTNHVGISGNLEIDDPDSVFPKIAQQIRFKDLAKPDTSILLDELQELVAKLLPRCKKIQVKMINQGFSGAAVIAVTPWYRTNGKGQMLIAKLGELPQIELERKNYSEYVEGMIGGHRLPKTINVARTRLLGGILYTYAGMEKVQDFGDYCRVAHIEDILLTLENLFLNTCEPWAAQPGQLIPNQNLRAVFMKHLRLTDEKLVLVLERLTGKNKPFIRMGEDFIALTNNHAEVFINPVKFALDSALRADCYQRIIHGDLYGNNILVDHHNETWLIDFERTGPGLALQDFVSLDNYVRMSLYENIDLQTWLKWERLSTADPPEFPPESHSISKSFHISKKIRALASQTQHYDRKIYLTGLLFNALRTATLLGLSINTRSHALLSACLISEELAKEQLCQKF